MSIPHASLADTTKLVIVRSSIVPTCPFGQCPFVQLQSGTGSNGRPLHKAGASLKPNEWQNRGPHPMPLPAPPAELECGGDWQILAASARIVSGFSLETNGYRLDFRLPQNRLTYMTFFKKFSGKKAKPEMDTPTLNWIEASENPWGIKLLDLRPITQRMLSTSQHPQMAANAVSYGSEDGTSFINQEPESGNEITAEISLSVDLILAPGVLFIPDVMERKWAIFFHQNTIIFVRSWLRKVIVTADTSQRNGRLYINKIKGQFSDDDEPEFTRATVKFLLISHAIGEIFPAPLPDDLSSDLKSAGLWAMSMYGNMAHVGIFTSNFEGSTQSPIRSHSLLHIAVARNDLNEINLQVENGIPIDILAADGLAPLPWSLATEDLQAMQHLIKLGADPNVRSIEGATPMMNAVQSNKVHHLNLLISSGADANARDNRGFTSLHRAAEMGHAEIIEILLNNGAEPNIEADGYTPLSVAEMRGAKKVVSLLRGHQ
jgi:hypothetical protein